MFIISGFVLLGTGLTVVSGPDVVKVVVKEGEDAILPCSFSTKENIELKLFDWKKDGQKEVFMYDAGVTYGNGHTGQEAQFRGRVFHFPDQLKVGNASIVIKQTKVTDRGNYTCDFPRLHPQRRFHIELVVALILKDKTEENIPGAVSKPSIKTLEQTQHIAVLQCEVQGAFPKPQLQWQDRGGNIVPAEKPQVTERGGRYDVILNTTVTKTDHYRCVVTQEEINHQVYYETYVYICGAAPEPTVTALKVTKDNAVLQCKVRGAFPKPQLQWQDRGGNIVPAEEPQVTESEGRYDVILNTTVTKTDTYRCVVTQEEINHQVYSETYVYISGSGFPIGWVLGGVGLVVGFLCGVVVVLGAAPSIRWYKKQKDKKEACEEDDQPVWISQ